jgi:hypothetical protein
MKFTFRNGFTACGRRPNAVVPETNNPFCSNKHAEAPYHFRWFSQNELSNFDLSFSCLQLEIQDKEEESRVSRLQAKPPPPGFLFRLGVSPENGSDSFIQNSGYLPKYTEL